MTTPSPQAIFEEAVALQEKGDLKGALERYDRLLAAMPDDPQLLNIAACANFELGETAKAEERFRRAVKLRPDFADAWNNLGLMLQQAGRLKDALSAYERLRKLAPGAPVAHANCANVNLLLERYAPARRAYEEALKLAPEDVNTLCAYAKTLLGLGEWGEALAPLDRALALNPGYCGALALKLVAMQELGHDEAFRALGDFDRLVDTGTVEPPAGYADLAAFNAALAEHCLNHPSLEYERPANATRKGHHSGNFAHDADPGPVAHLLDIVNARAARYAGARPADPAHPYLAQRPAKWTHDIWCVILGDHGYQDPHVHPGGWLSGVYYVSVPDAVSDEEEDAQGWIEFGRPIAYPRLRAEPRVRLCRPEEGKMILFPSYFYHRTVPFRSAQKRISIAFDLIPAG